MHTHVTTKPLLVGGKIQPVGTKLDCANWGARQIIILEKRGAIVKIQEVNE